MNKAERDVVESAIRLDAIWRAEKALGETCPQMIVDEAVAALQSACKALAIHRARHYPVEAASSACG